MMPVHAAWCALTDAGGRRQVNEDAVLAEPPVFLVADGMGGHEHGAVASQCVVDAFSIFARGVQAGTVVRPADILQVVARAQHLIRTRVTSMDPTWVQRPDTVIGSTVAGVILTSLDGVPYWLAFNVGDSRIYRYDASGLDQISVDHSLVQELIDAGSIEPADARTHPGRNVVTRAIDATHSVEVDFWMLHAAAPHRLLLCSDGLTGELVTDDVAHVLAQHQSPQQTSAELIRCATLGGARDNVSVVVVEMEAEHASDLTDPRVAGQSGAVTDSLRDWEDTLPRSAFGANH